MKYKPDTLNEIKDSDLIQLSRNLLDSVVTSTDMLVPKNMSPERLQEAKVVLGYLNAANKTILAKMQYFKMVGLGEKVKAVKKNGKNL